MLLTTIFIQSFRDKEKISTAPIYVFSLSSCVQLLKWLFMKKKKLLPFQVIIPYNGISCQILTCNHHLAWLTSHWLIFKCAVFVKELYHDNHLYFKLVMKYYSFIDWLNQYIDIKHPPHSRNCAVLCGYRHTQWP